MEDSAYILNRTVVTSFCSASANNTNNPSSDSYYDQSESVYVLHIAKQTDLQDGENQTHICCGLSDKSVHVYDIHTHQKSYDVPGKQQHHRGPITDMIFRPKSNMILTSSEDGCVRIFDTRTSYTGNGSSSGLCEVGLPLKEEALSISTGYDGSLVAVGGSKGKIHFYDLRMAGDNHNNLLGSYVDAHTEEVTSVEFQSSSSSLLLTASEDGLMCIHDTAQPNEENALKSVMNIGTPIRSANFFGPNLDGCWCVTGSETMSIYHHESAQPISQPYLNLKNNNNIREYLTQQVRARTTHPQIQIDYLVGCQWNSRKQELSLLAGSSDGNAAVFNVDASSISLSQTLHNGHKGCVRSFQFIQQTGEADLSNNLPTLFTGAEDARLCEWTSRNSNTRSSKNIDASFIKMNGFSSKIGCTSGKKKGGPIRKHKKKQQHSPY